MSDKNLRENLLEVLSKESAHVNFEQSIKDIPRDMRGKKIYPGGHSIYQEVEHIRIAMEDLFNYTTDPGWKSPEWPHEFWPADSPDISDEKWNNTISSIRMLFGKLADLIKNEKLDLTSEIPHGEGRTYLREILLVIDHNSYHMGQLLVVRKALGIWKGGL